MRDAGYLTPLPRPERRRTDDMKELIRETKYGVDYWCDEEEETEILRDEEFGAYITDELELRKGNRK